MNRVIENLGVIVQIVQIATSLAVIVTIFFLFQQIRLARKDLRNQSVQSMTSSIAAINVPAMENPKIGHGLRKAEKSGWHAMDEDERVAVHFFIFSFFKMCEQALFMKKSGTLDAGQWSGWEMAVLRYYHSRGINETWWPNRRTSFSRAFRSFLEGSKSPGEPLYYDPLFADPDDLSTEGSQIHR